MRGVSGPGLGSMPLSSSKIAQAHNKQIVTGGAPEHRPAVTAIGAKLCATGSFPIWGKAPDPGSPYLN